ncbi:MAG: ATP-binding cassette domain-containing protein, partial [Salinibacter sp.]
MIELDGVTKRYGDAYAVRAITLTAPAEATTVLIGPSGSGKSTLLRLMIGLTRPDGGTVSVEGQQLTPANVRTLRHRMGYVIQEGGLFPHLTGRANAALLARHLGWSADRIDARIEELTRLVQ